MLFHNILYHRGDFTLNHVFHSIFDGYVMCLVVVKSIYVELSMARASSPQYVLPYCTEYAEVFPDVLRLHVACVTVSHKMIEVTVNLMELK